MACWPAQYGTSNGSGDPTFSMIPGRGPPSAMLSERTSVPFSQTANAKKSTTLCIACRISLRPAPSATRCGGSRDGWSSMNSWSQMMSADGKLPA
jgi:hypothetical protein